MSNIGSAASKTGSAASSSIATTYRYTGREYDVDTGLYYYRNRWYDPETGRFISEDPIGFAGGDVNLYSYVWNSPYNFIDPFGLSPKSGYKERCRKWKKAIANIEKEIKKRTGEMHENPLGLPWVASGDKQKPSLSRRGHRDIVSKLKARKAELEAYVAAYCDDDSDKKRLVPSAAPVPIPTKSNVNNKSFCPMPIKPPNQPTMEELRLQIEANRQREKFWTKVLVGSTVGGALYLAGPTAISYGAAALSSVRGRGFSPSFGY